MTVATVIPVDFRPVLVDFAAASTPRSEIAQRLAAEASEQSAKLAKGDKKAGTLRLLSAGRGDLFNLNPYLIAIKEGWNSREAGSQDNLDHVDSLARSIAEIGVQQPLTVVLEGEKAFVTDGHCRLLATFRAIEVYGAEIKSVPVRAESRFTSPADHVLRQLLTGKALTVVEQGNAFVKLTNFGWTTGQIAAKAGISEVRVTQILDLMAGSSEALKAMVVSGKVAANTVAQALREAGGDVTLAETVLKDAVAVAKKAGKTRATPKHVREAQGTTKTPLKVVLRNIFAAQTTHVDTSGEDVTITLSAADWANMAELLKI